jgi:hypothetical protein
MAAQTGDELLASRSGIVGKITVQDILDLPGPSSLVEIACKNTSGGTITIGTPVYQTGTVGATATIEVAPANALISAGNYPAIGLLKTTLLHNDIGFVVITGALTNIITSPIDGVVPTTGDTIYLKSGGGLTLTKPTGEGNAIQNMGLVGKVSGGNSGSITVSSIMRANDVPNLPTGRIWVGDGNTLVSNTVFVDEPNLRLGIGTTSPATKLDVNGDLKIGTGTGLDTISCPSQILARFNNTTSDFTYGPITANPVSNDFTFQGDNIHYGNITTGYIALQDSIGMSDSPIQSDYTNVSIGYPTSGSIPEALSVIGNVYASGDFIAGGKMLVDSALLSNQENIDVDTGTETVAEISSTTYTAAFFDFVIKNGTNLRAGIVSACHDGSSNVEYNEVSTNDLGDTSDVTLSVDISGGNIRLRATTTSDNWSIKSLVRGL